MRSIDKFTGKADTYVKYRPSYPVTYLEYLISVNQLSADCVIDDMGSGTEILTQ